MVWFECPRHWNSSVSFNFKVGWIPLSIIGPLGNKNWPPSLKVKKLKIFQHKMGSMSCIWFILNAPGTETPLSHPIFKLGESLFPLLALWVIRIVLSVWKLKSWKSSSRKWAQWAAYGPVWMPTGTASHPILGLGEFPFPLLELWGIRNGSPVWKWKSWINFGVKLVQKATNSLVWCLRHQII